MGHQSVTYGNVSGPFPPLSTLLLHSVPTWLAYTKGRGWDGGVAVDVSWELGE